MFRHLLVGACVVPCLTVSLGVRAGAAIPPQGKVGAHQYFEGLVNGQPGIGTPVQIKMACFGAVRPGEKGHPMAGQTVEVTRPLVIVVGHSGYTGKNATSIVAFFGPLPDPAPATAAASTVTFKQYGVTKRIPTSLLLPCAGSGTVSFVPLPKSPPTSRRANVRVSYVGQP